MSQRLSSTRKHPITGEEIAPLWFDQDGIAFYPPMGAAPDGDDDGDGTGDSDGDGDGDSGESGTEGQDGSGNGSTGNDDDVEALRKRMQAADRRAAAAEKRAKELEDKDKDEATKTAERLAEAEKERDALREQVRDLTLKTAFLSANDVSWHDADVALSNADLSEVMQEDGTVDKKALKKALEDLSKAKPFLVKQAEKTDDPPSGPTGIPAGSGKKKDNGKVDEDSLRRKYPALYP